MWFSIPALAKVLCVFGLILVLNRIRLGLSLCLFIGSLVLGFWMKLGPGEVIRSTLQSLSQLQTISLFLIVGSILVISRLMKESRHMDRIVEGFGGLSGNERTAGLVLPALIGLLPMPGGALFSAPMVETTFNKCALTSAQQTAVNYWFRHIWEYWWPLYPAVVLAVALLKVETWQFIVFMMPMTLVMVLAGIVFILKPIQRESVQQKKGFSASGLKTFLWEIIPILIVVMVIILLEGSAALLNLAGVNISISGVVSILPGLLVSLIWVGVVNRISFRQLAASVYDRSILSILLLVAAIMIFQGMMKDSRAVVDIRTELMAYHIPMLLVIVIMPFLSGLITGIGIGFVGTSFPLIIPLFPADPLFAYLSYAALAYVFGFMGMMLSPVHLCLLVTKDYFKAGLLDSYRSILKPLLTVMTAAVVFFLISRVI
jgi:integral membrane protein (TIGR00529 family)